MPNNSLLIDVFTLQHETGNLPVDILDELISLIESQAPTAHIYIDEYYNIIVYKGDTSKKHPYIVSHYDQVHKVCNNFTLQRNGQILSAIDSESGTQIGVGGDDKCGIFICLSMLSSLDDVTIILFSDEEYGCIGSSQIDINIFDNASVVIQCDRKGNYDICTTTNGIYCVTDTYLLDTMHILEKFGYIEAIGTVTDVGELKHRGLQASCFNLSCGYYYAHTAKEIVNVNELYNCLALVSQLITVPWVETHNSFPITLWEDDTCHYCYSELQYDYIEDKHVCINCMEISTNHNYIYDWESQYSQYSWPVERRVSVG